MKVLLHTLPKNKTLSFEYQFYKTKLGMLLIVSWQKSLVYIAFAKSKKEALTEAKARFPKAHFLPKEHTVHRNVIQYLEKPKVFNKTISLAVEGSTFQIKVWQALLNIPFGKTIFYSDLAKAVKKPSAVRAVASAVAKNPLAILIPCHRVLPRSGGFGKYHWGTKNKSALLVWEGFSLAKK